MGKENSAQGYEDETGGERAVGREENGLSHFS